MPSITRSVSTSTAVGELLTLSDERAAASVVIAPRRGALVTAFEVHGRPLLYLDAASLSDATKNVRGGIPVLFPSPGKLEGDSWLAAGQAGQMKQHGFARNVPWAVGETATAGAAAVTLVLESSPLTLAQYPWEFRAELRFELEQTRLRLVAHVENRSKTAMPFALGYHPYFLAAEKASVQIDTHATRAFDNVTKQVVAFRGFDLTQPEVDLHLLDHGSSASALRFADGSRIELAGSPEFTRWVVWTVAGKDFVCLEPWTAPGNALNTGEGLFNLLPARSRQYSLDITWLPR